MMTVEVAQWVTPPNAPQIPTVDELPPTHGGPMVRVAELPGAREAGGKTIICSFGLE
jgi:hypothetical protein